MTGFAVTNEQMLLQFGSTFASINVRTFEPAEARARIVCFHGFVGNAHDFDALAAFLASSGVAVVAADMYGRGDSAHFSNSRQYGLRRVAAAAAALLAKRGHNATVLGVGWGALIGLLGLRLAGISPRAFIGVDLNLDFAVDNDPVIAQALADRGSSFATADAAVRHVRSSPEFTGAPVELALAHRVRADGEVFRLSHDDGITQRTKAFGGREYDLRAQFAQLKTRVLLLNAEAGGERPIWASVIGGLNPGGRLHVATPAERLIVLGAAHAGQLP
jgi:pimeloyl-ACP methyl ester carboxylesterase